VDRVVPAPELMNAVGEIAKKIVGNAPLAVQAVMQAVEDGGEAELFGKVCGTEEMKARTRAFLEKRK
jgi:enoyl-CoA hydratase